MSLSDRYKNVLQQINDTAVAAGREPQEISLVAVSKTHPVPVIREAIAAGAVIFGENKVQEGCSKIEELGNEVFKWHLIGHLQTNKVRKAVTHFDVIETIDSMKLAKRVARIAEEERETNLGVFAQIDLAGEKSKFGADPSALGDLAGFLSESKALDFQGLMIIPPYCENPEDVRPFFIKIREIRDSLRDEGMFGIGNGALSMGMSHDFHIAIEEGATHVRVGTAIFGARNYPQQ
jgi:pyridoxal phosphate enzyme (YggS family)